MAIAGDCKSPTLGFRRFESYRFNFKRKIDRVVYCSSLENCRAVTGTIGSNPISSAKIYRAVEKMASRHPHKVKVVGSSPIRATII